jgi:hypothetical protein
MNIEEQSVMARAISIISDGFRLCPNADCEELYMVRLDRDLGIQRHLPPQLGGDHTAQALQSRVREDN